MLKPAFLSALFVCLSSAQNAPVKEIELPGEPGLYAIIDTSMGTMVAKLYEDKAPNTVKSFVDLAEGAKPSMTRAGQLTKHPYYNGLLFHRVVKGFMIQTGDVRGTGSGNCGIPNLKDEIDKNLNFNAPGVLAMANTGKPNTAACQFFITVAPAPYLKGQYTVFGHIVSGQYVADNISTVPTLSTERPMGNIVLKSITIKRKQ